MNQHLFISYSRIDGAALAEQLASALRAGTPPYEVWMDRTDIPLGSKFTVELDEAVKCCRCLVYLMTDDSVSSASFCLNEIGRAGRYKKPILPVMAGKNVTPPIDLESVQHVDMTGDFGVGLAALRSHLLWTETPAGQLSAAKYQRAGLERSLSRAGVNEKHSIEDELTRVNQRITELQGWLADPEHAKQRVEVRIRDQIEVVRHASDFVKSLTSGKFINSASFVPPLHFQDRHAETKLAVEFLKNPDKRLLTIVGRGGVGKTGMVCRLLKGIEDGKLPDDLGELPAAGLVYLSEQRARRVSFPHLFEDLAKLLDPTSAEKAEVVYRSAQASPSSKMNVLLSMLPKGLIVVLLDNFEELVGEGRATKDRELYDALIHWLHSPPNDLKIIITTRVAPADISLAVPAACSEIALDEGLASPHAENLLKQLDSDGAVGLRSAPPETLTEVARRVRGYPRALEALYAVLRNDRNTSLDELLGKAAATLPEKVVEVMVGEAFSRLDRHEKVVLQAIAIFNRPVPVVAIDYLLQPFVPAVDSAPVLRWLVNLQIIRKDRDRYYLHPVDAEFALSQIPDDVSSPMCDSNGPAMTRKALLSRAAEYFREIRKPSAEWGSIEDIEPQLAEFDLLCRGEQYDEAASILLAIGFHYLRAWGHVRMLADLHERLRGRISDIHLEASCLGILGTSYWDLGGLAQAASDLEKCIAITEQTQGPNSAAAWWCDLGCCRGSQGKFEEALAAHERAMDVDLHTGDWSGVAVDIHNSAECYGEIGLTEFALQALDVALDVIPLVDKDASASSHRSFRLSTKACLLADAKNWVAASERAEEALRLAQSTNYNVGVARAGYYLALAALSQGDLKRASEAVRLSRDSEYPRFRFSALLLRGIISLQKNDRVEAQEDFSLCLKESEDLLQRSEEHYLARIHRALARCGLFVCGQTADVQAAKDILMQCTIVSRYAGIRSRCLHLLRMIAAHDPTRQLTRMVLLIEGSVMGQPAPASPGRSVLEHAAARKLRAALAPAHLSKLHSQGLFEQCVKAASDAESLVDGMSRHQRMEFLRVRAWAQARRGFLDGPSFLDLIQDEDYLKSLLRASDYMAVYRFQGMIPSAKLGEWSERGRQIAKESSKDNSGAQVLLDEYEGCALLAEGRYEAAQQSLQKALAAENAGKKDVRILARIQCSLGETYRLLGDLERAERFLETAAAFQQEHGFDGDFCEYTLPHLAKLVAGQPSVPAYLEQARTCAERLPHRKALLRVLLVEARITQNKARAGEILKLAASAASTLPAVMACPLWQRIQASWQEWCAGVVEPSGDYWGL